MKCFVELDGAVFLVVQCKNWSRFFLDGMAIDSVECMRDLSVNIDSYLFEISFLYKQLLCTQSQLCLLTSPLATNL